MSDPAPRSSDPLRGLRRNAVAVWVAWLLLLGLLWGQFQASILHPAAHLFLVLLIVVALLSVGATIRGLYRVLLGPKRSIAFVWMVLALSPAFLSGLLTHYTLDQHRRRNVPVNACTKLAVMAGCSLMELEALHLYPRRMESERLVMFFDDDNVKEPERDLEEMDRHVARLEEMTGRPIRAKIYWVRGPLLGLRNLAFQGLALGSWEGRAAQLDRHELAHAVLYQRHGPDTEPPMMLAEGWAESQSRDRDDLGQIALLARAGHPTLWTVQEWKPNPDACLPELLGPRWYHHDSGPVYHIGGAFVDYVLRKYGTERFVELYLTCRPDSVEADFARTLGVDVPTLESQFWEDVERNAERVQKMRQK
jgi:hypothetical protein